MRPYRLRRAVAALASCAALAAAAACTDAQGTGGDPTESPRTTTPTTQISSSPPPTPEEEAAAAALAAAEGYWQVSQESAQAPAARDWEPELRQYGDEAATAENLSSLQRLLEGGIRQDGAFTIDPEVSSVDLVANPQPTVMVMACFDSTSARTVYADTGELTPDPPPDQRPKYPQWQLRVTVLQYPGLEGAPWLVHDFEPLTDQQC